VIRNIFCGIVLLLAFQSALSTRAEAQVGPSCDFKFSVWSWEAAPLGANCIAVGVEGADPCDVKTAYCAPAAAPTETCPCQHTGNGGSGSSGSSGGGAGSTSGRASSAQVGNPIYLATGDTYIAEDDIKRVPGLGGGLGLSRTWNSLWPVTQSAYQIGLFGPNWRSTFEERVFIGADHYIKYARSDGSFWSFGYTSLAGGGILDVAAPANATATLVPGSSYWTLTFQNGEQRLFDNTTGPLTAIIDRNGNTTTLSYDVLGRLTTVSDPASRQLYFVYGSGTNLVTSVTSNFGESVSYSYDSQGRLSQVTEPDASTVTFQYDSNSFISAVLDSNGKILESHTYDSSGRGLTSSRANGVEAVTITYNN
jgi:YD repeat-containing protein